jgi:hypothetical protein
MKLFFKLEYLYNFKYYYKKYIMDVVENKESEALMIHKLNNKISSLSVLIQKMDNKIQQLESKVVDLESQIENVEGIAQEALNS